MEDLRYPIGKFQYQAAEAHAGAPPGANDERLHEWIGQIAEAPARLRAAVTDLTSEQLDTPYRPEGWTVRQVVHHVPDSHINSYSRFRLALTEDQPAVKGYDENLWAELFDARTAPTEPSLALLENLHQRWIILLKSLTPEQLARTFHHSELGPVSLHKNIALYAWHGRHHVAHITKLRERMGW